MRTFKKALIFVFAAIGFLDLVGRGILLPFSGTFFGYAFGLPGDIKIDEVSSSPDGSLKAIKYTWTGSAFNAGCYQSVAVVNRWKSVNTAWQGSHLVYQADCGDSSVKVSWEPPAQGRVRPRLRIDADVTKADLMSRFALGGTVAIAYRNDP